MFVAFSCLSLLVLSSASTSNVGVVAVSADDDVTDLMSMSPNEFVDSTGNSLLLNVSSIDTAGGGSSGSGGVATATGGTKHLRVLFLRNVTSCTMYSKKCFVKVLIWDYASLRSSFKVKTQSRKIIEYKSMEACSALSNGSSLRKECRLTYDELVARNLSLSFGMENLYLIRVRAKLVGIRNLEIEYLLDSSTDVEPSGNVSSISVSGGSSSAALVRVIRLEHRVIVTRPERFIDTFQVIYIVVFSILISVIMGILLDVDTLVKIIKMPFPVFIGFISQYLFMPLVNIFR
jgi:hypothetical protein